jgi:hypothetical protein
LEVIKCIYLPPTHLHFIDDIEDRCLLLTNSTSFVDLPFEEHRMMKKHYMDQNPYISLLCPKPEVVSNNMTQGDDMTKSPGPADPRWGPPSLLLGRLAMVWRQCNYAFNTCHVKSVRRGSEVGKSVRRGSNSIVIPRWVVGLTSGPPSATLAQSTDLTPL